MIILIIVKLFWIGFIHCLNGDYSFDSEEEWFSICDEFNGKGVWTFEKDPKSQKLLEYPDYSRMDSECIEEKFAYDNFCDGF